MLSGCSPRYPVKLMAETRFCQFSPPLCHCFLAIFKCCWAIWMDLVVKWVYIDGLLLLLFRKLPGYAMVVKVTKFALKCHDTETLDACFFRIRYFWL